MKKPRGDAAGLFRYAVFVASLPDEILSHIHGAGDEDDEALYDVLHIRVDAESCQSHEDQAQKHHAEDNTADLTDIFILPPPF